ncbi:hypothetical protein F6R98_15090 [Candidatus Methylospira mobilis]|uniref:Hemerythrin-like domain-containing protein n=1 Tax=Candidatus Methylospira mobilis TaxID=1808979 RepID=A0A5Q0BNX0_9GAMM|nr:hemerythrin domain-containing protein [Candidatus Methylospira mobilis]QFY43787.1 hypothetical protein F6R98_15090 [Candidatus Methylospira mobilis]WNV04777.1 hemerythrin domain-containing protein [Candidatus Methylospira mobilis]
MLRRSYAFYYLERLSFSVGVAEINEQHEKLAQLINDLHEHMRNGDAADIIAGVLGETIEFIAFHFTMEEALMKQHGYAFSSDHLP